MFVQYCVVKEENTSTVNVSVIQGGKAKNVTFVTMNVRFPTATDMGTAQMESACALEDSRANFAKRVSHGILFSLLIVYKTY